MDLWGAPFNLKRTTYQSRSHVFYDRNLVASKINLPLFYCIRILSTLLNQIYCNFHHFRWSFTLAYIKRAKNSRWKRDQNNKSKPRLDYPTTIYCWIFKASLIQYRTAIVQSFYTVQKSIRFVGCKFDEPTEHCKKWKHKRFNGNKFGWKFSCYSKS